MRSVFLLTLLLSSVSCFAQKKVLSSINAEVLATDAAAHLSFLAADEMRGRDTGSRELEIAANYIATEYKRCGAKPAAGMKGFFQDVQLEKTAKPTVATLSIDTARLKSGVDLLYISGASVHASKQIVFIGYGTKEDFDRIDVKDKIVVTYAGEQGGVKVGQAMRKLGPEKQKIAAEHGAVALVEIFNIPGVPWQELANYLSTGQVSLRSNSTNSIPHLWIKNSERVSITKLVESKQSTGEITLDVKPSVPVNVRNVIGVIEGTDARLKQEWITVSAHYDHVGVKKGAGVDSIYNGARDNAIGTVAILESVKYFSVHRPKRSIAFIALTAEEVGLLGSDWYVEHPVIPLKQTIFNFNCDGAGYNDTTLATVIDFNRTTSDDLLRKAFQSQGLTLTGDPAPEENLYDRSDNANFAKKGVPAVDIAPGVKGFDAELFKYYHQPADEFESLDMNYLQKFYRSFVYAVYLLSSDAAKPGWKEGDKYEKAGKELYEL